ncbi:hypothetical protein CLAFUW4_03623 [Fulvia fulva]|uniref:Uncharacterized protein n=1 Tax=Passalora fulva TaxID=5499 RepID=A0A9Q8P5V0_PASFU|nr:uncharacterized protein CLAFUR5_03601 [Fulvia fulva]KAK4631498.1 hypothetical protein CLAFUR4_03611 [Fulvia fulva]KAK4632529.1 hypothetical protein CLAFUR0_03614 [Fulvia fulva]UJO14281.1 hypothetical protein CLAFUR5_03601 [Fulvia fulva]WPV10430.1 hypothetical protein CLAFUW4_03623 [Fulvia fulva]WPV26584.1 hypothetical protein CLAFUW7_03615 [Fulvia fulva]
MLQTPATTPKCLPRSVSRIPGKRQSTSPQKVSQAPISKPPPMQSAITAQSPPEARRLPEPSRRSYLPASATDLPKPPQPATRNMKKPSRIATVNEARTRVSNGVLTPGSVHFRASSTSKSTATSGIATPQAPKKQALKASGGESHALSSDSKSLFMKGHVGEHCIHGALVHKLACGHKVITMKVEDCASNCVRPLLKHLQQHANHASEEAFVCSACIEQHVQSHREAKRTLFEQTYKVTERKMIAFPDGWLEKQRAYWEKVWENDTVMERSAFALLGRKCAHFGDNVVGTSMKKERSSTAVPFPAKRRLKASRGSHEKSPESVLGDKMWKDEANGNDSRKRDSLLE